MAKHLFELPPDKGAAALDAFLARAARHGLHVEVVALADTASYEMDMAAHVRRIGATCARHPNALLEIANEPYHATQRAEVHDAKYLERLRAEVPPGVPVALGAGDNPAVLTGGDYVTVHFPRSIAREGWGWVAALGDARRMLKTSGKPVIDDEPLGAGQRFEPGRRDADPEKFRAAALAGRLTGIGSTFHYEGGLQARLASGRELECLRVWSEAWTIIPGDGPLDPFAVPGRNDERDPGAPALQIRIHLVRARHQADHGEVRRRLEARDQVAARRRSIAVGNRQRHVAHVGRRRIAQHEQLQDRRGNDDGEQIGVLFELDELLPDEDRDTADVQRHCRRRRTAAGVRTAAPKPVRAARSVQKVSRPAPLSTIARSARRK